MTFVRCVPRRLSCRRLSCRRLLLTLFFLLLVSFLVFHYQSYQWLTSCSTLEATAGFHAICRDFLQTEVDGTACRDICLRKYEFLSCLNYRSGKKVWRLKRTRRKKQKETFVILKTSRNEPYKLPRLSVNNNNNHDNNNHDNNKNNHNNNPHLFDVNEFQHLIADSVNSQLSPSIHVDAKDPLLLRKVFGNSSFILDLPSNSTSLTKKQRAGMDSLWQLIQQDEFLISSVLAPHLPGVAPVQGFCGRFYSVKQYHVLSNSQIRRLNLKQRVNVILSLLDLLEHFEKDLKEPLNICDMKLSNFGFRSSNALLASSSPSVWAGQVLKSFLIDSDSVAFDTRLSSIFRHTTIANFDDVARKLGDGSEDEKKENAVIAKKAESGLGQVKLSSSEPQIVFYETCATDADCAFFDCASVCTGNKLCSSHRANNNLQSFCGKILHPSKVLSLVTGNEGFFHPSLVGNEEAWKEFLVVATDCDSAKYWEACQEFSSKPLCILRTLSRFRRVLLKFIKTVY